MVIVAIPIFVAGFYAVHRHYRYVARHLAAGIDAVKRARGRLTNEIVLPVRDLDGAARAAAWYSRAIAGTSFRGIYAPTASGPDPRDSWWDFSGGCPPLELVGGDGERGPEAVRQ
jgi:hypothetical protein